MLLLALATEVRADRILIPMDLKQTDHLKAYGVAYWVLERELEVEWLLNYRGGSFLVPAGERVLRDCRLNGVAYEPVTGSALAQIRAVIDRENMESVKLERPTRLAVYAPPASEPWDDAVRIGLE